MTLPEESLQLSESTSAPYSSASPPESTPNDAAPRAATSSARHAAAASGLACDPCRKRKLKCDRIRPVCSSCSRAAIDCKYETIRKRTGPRKGHLKHLYDRLAHMEALLQNSNSTADTPSNDAVGSHDDEMNPDSPSATSPAAEESVDIPRIQNSSLQSANRFPPQPSAEPISQLLGEMVSLDIDDVAPSPLLMDELDVIFFRNIYQTLPILHKQRFMASRDPTLRSGHLKALRYAMWALAAGSVEQYAPMQQDFYRKARKCLLTHEDTATGELNPTLEQCQAWLMVTIYEFKKLDMPAAWLSVGRTVRLAQMLSLQRLDVKPSETAKLYLPFTKDPIENEERRRTFWVVFWADQMASMGLGWPSSIREADITTKLPDFEDAFQAGRTRSIPSFGDILGAKVRDFSALAGYGVVNVVIARILNHLYHPWEDDQKHDVKGNFWKRHREIDSTLLELGMRMPVHLRINQGYGNPFVMMHNTHFWIATLVLHQAAILHATKYKLPHRILEDSRTRSLAAAAEITTCMRAVSHLDLSTMNAFMTYGAYVAAKVFLQCLEDQGQDHEMLFAVKFLYEMLQAFSRIGKNACLYRAQLDLDLQYTLMDCDGHRRSIKSQLWGGEESPTMSVDSEKAQDVDRFETRKKLFDPFTVLMIRENSNSSTEASSPQNSPEGRTNDGQEQIGDRLQTSAASFEGYAPNPRTLNYGNGVNIAASERSPNVLPGSLAAFEPINHQEIQSRVRQSIQHGDNVVQPYPWPQMQGATDFGRAYAVDQTIMPEASAYNAEQPWLMPNLGQWEAELLELHQDQGFDWTEIESNQQGSLG